MQNNSLTDSATDAATQAGAADALDRVSFPDEQLLLVDSEDRVLGYGSKQRLHAGNGLLHRAFSVFLFDEQQRVLVHRRSAAKPLWPGFWTNSCCSHPRRGEKLESAVARRVREELGVDARELESVYHFEYRAHYEEVGSEFELCHVFLARIPRGAVPGVHPEEIAEWCWLSPAEVDEWMRSSPDELTPWFRLEWAALRSAHSEQFDAYLARVLDPRSAA